ncbi:MAG: DUF1501 domain-containing protein, partial [Gemmataceae bacterium]|nr:DUF1501 domain-containing protein [Gemmataceae bacterium]
MAYPRGCAGFTRRDVLRLGAVGLSALTLPLALKAEATKRRQARAKNVIFIWQQGGPPHQDMWDMKPEAPQEYRGEFRPI